MINHFLSQQKILPLLDAQILKLLARPSPLQKDLIFAAVIEVNFR